MFGFLVTPSMEDIARLEARIAELEQKLSEHTHGYRANGFRMFTEPPQVT